jgi:hypothetical protein
MGRTNEEVGYQQKSSYPGITPDIAASGVDEALKVLEGRWKLIILSPYFICSLKRHSGSASWSARFQE